MSTREFYGFICKAIAKSIIAAICSAVVVSSALAAEPQSGWWWNPSQPGRGYFIEIKNGSAFVGSFLYQDSGQAIWYATGPATFANNTITGNLTYYQGGQTLTGAYRSPTSSSSQGSISIAFSDATHGTITWPGGVVPIVRFELQPGSLSAQRGSSSPETGWWWNSSEGGRGFSLEVQGDNMFLAGFMYNASGDPVWYVSGGRMTTSSLYQGDWMQYANGQTLGGTWKPAAIANASVGSVQVVFSTPTTATLRLPDGRQLSLSRFAFGSNSSFNMAQTISDEAQRTTLAFSGLALMTGNLQAQSFFPPGKVADYTGFQYLRDNDPDNMGHNTSFLTRIANNVIYILDDSQFAQLKTLATAQMDQIDLYGYKRFPLMKAFRRTLEGDIPSASSGLNLNAVKKASRELYLIDGQISFDRAVLYANIIQSLSASQKTYLEAMKGKGWSSWPDVTNDQIRVRMASLPQGSAVAVMTYASDLFSWYAGSIEADVYFCPERHGTYFGSFYIKDAPAIGHEGYSINEQLTATAGAALSDASKGYVTPAQATLMSSLVDTQRNNLYASSSSNIVKLRTDIATLLRSLLTTTGSTDAIKTQVLALSATYGELDGANNHAYASVFAQVYKTLTSDQKNRLAALRQSILSGRYADGTAFDYTTATNYYLYSQVISNQSVLTPYIGNTDALFFEP